MARGRSMNEDTSVNDSDVVDEINSLEPVPESVEKSKKKTVKKVKFKGPTILSTGVEGPQTGDFRTVVRRESKLYIHARKGKNEPILKEIVLNEIDYKGEPESVTVSCKTTVCPRQFESISVGYSCTIQHTPGESYRMDAFDVAKFHCMERIVEDVKDLHSKNVIQDHYLISKENGVE